MGLLARRRSPNRASQPAAAPTVAPAAPADSPRPLIRPEDLAGAPGWTQLPPTPPLLPPVPFVVSRSFSDDLVTWRAPEMQVGPLGHGLSDLAPQGTVAAVAVLDAEPLVRLDTAEQTSTDGSGLPLAHPSSGAPEENPQQVALGFRRPAVTPEIRGSEAFPAPMPAPAVAADVPVPSPAEPAMPLVPGTVGSPGDPLPATAPSAPEPTSSPAAAEARAEQPTAPPLTAPVAGAGAPEQAPAARTASAPVVRPFVESPVPPQLPLIQLKTAPAAAVPPARGEAAPAVAGLDEGGVTVAVAPLLGSRPPLDEEMADAVTASPDTAVTVGPAGPAPATGLELAQAAGTEAPGMQSGVPPAPAPPFQSEAQRRSGLGEPLHDLPATAASLDAASLAASYARRPRAANPAAQMPLAIAAATRAAAATPAAPGRGAQRPAAAVTQPAPTYAETASLPVVHAEPERFIVPTGSPASTPPLPPAPQATVALVPFHPIAPAATERAAAEAGREGAALKAVVGRRHGVDLSDVTVDRSPAATAKAQAMGADAFTAGDRVVIPKSFGTLDAGPGKALLAHELTHAAQQRQAGGRAVPAEHTPAGQTMEAAAVATELSLVSPGASVPRPLSPPPALPGTGRASSVSAAASSPASPPASTTRPAGTPATSALPLARSESTSIDDGVLTAALLRLGALNGTPAPVTAAQAPAFAAPASAPAAAPAPAAAAPVQHAWSIRTPFTNKPKPAPVQTTSPFSARPSDADLAKLASWLYPLISFKIRRELKTDRERAGLLTDLYRR